MYTACSLVHPNVEYLLERMKRQFGCVLKTWFDNGEGLSRYDKADADK